MCALLALAAWPGTAGAQAQASDAPRCPQIQIAPGDPGWATTYNDPPPALGDSVLPRRDDGRLQMGLNDPWALGSSYVERRLDLQRRLGATLVRYDIPWGAMQRDGPDDTPRWDSADRLYCAALERGLRPILVLTTVPWWATGHSRQCPQEPLAPWVDECFMPPSADHVADLQAWAKQVAYRYNEAAAIEAWNEPNLPSTWIQPDDLAQEPPAQTYVNRVLTPIYVGAKSGAPNVPVLGGSLAGPSSGAYLGEMYAARPTSAARHMDAVTVHPYATRSFTSYDQAMTLVEQTLDAQPGPRAHLVVSEVGATYSVLDGGRRQSAVLQAVYRDLEARSGVDAVIFHTLLNASTGQADEGYGWVLNVAGLVFLPRPVYTDFAALLGPAQAG